MIGLPGPLVAFCVNKKGVRFTMALGTSLVTIGALMMALFVRTALQVDIVFGVIVGLGAITGGPIAAQSGVGRWFERRKAFAISLAITSTGIGGFVAAPLLDRVIVSSGGNWRAGWWLICGLSFLATLLALFFIKEKPSDLGQFPDGELPAPSVNGSLAAGSQVKRGVYRTAEEWSFAETLHSPIMWLMLISLIGFSSSFSTALGHGIVHLRDLGYTPTQAAVSFSVISLFSLIGSLVVAALGDQFEPRNIFAARLACRRSGDSCSAPCERFDRLVLVRCSDWIRIWKLHGLHHDDASKLLWPQGLSYGDRTFHRFRKRASSTRRVSGRLRV